MQSRTAWNSACTLVELQLAIDKPARPMRFEDIKIDEFDADKTTRIGDSGLFKCYLNLSDSPPVDWKRIFDSEWTKKLYMMKREAYCTGGVYRHRG